MKRPGFLLTALAAVSLSVALAAEPVRIPREDAYKLCRELQKIPAGLTPANTISVAENINALIGIADAVEKGNLRMQREQMRVKEGPEKTEQTLRLAEAFDAKCEEEVVVELTLIEISKDEIKEARISSGALASVLRWLRPKKVP